jgi:two-component system sensor histidine kinase YesM
VFIVNRAGQIVYHPRLRLVYSKLKTELIDRLVSLADGQLAAKVDGEGLLYVATTSHYTGWTIVGVSYDRELYAPISRLESWYALFGILCLLVSALVSYAVAEKITRPIQVLRERMQEVERGATSRCGSRWTATRGGRTRGGLRHRRAEGQRAHGPDSAWNRGGQA